MEHVRHVRRMSEGVRGILKRGAAGNARADLTIPIFDTDGAPQPAEVSISRFTLDDVNTSTAFVLSDVAEKFPTG